MDPGLRRDDDSGPAHVFSGFGGMRRKRGFQPSLLLVALALLALFALAPRPAASAELPGDSVYRIGAQLTDSHGTDFAFAEAAGQVRLATMFYANCPYVCPMLIEQVRRIEGQLDDAERARLRVLMITVDPARDTPEALAALAEKRRIDTARWTLARPAPADLRKIAAVLDVQYRQLDDGEFNHSSVVTLLDPQGRVLARTSRLSGAPDAEFVDALRKALAAQPAQ